MIKIPNYKIIKKIGEGGMGDVYLAEHEIIKRKVAVKSLHNKFVKNTELVERFRKEAENLSRLKHPNIVELIEYYEDKTGLYLLMEYVDGRQLDTYLKKETGPIPEAKLIPLFSQLLEAIGYAHSKGLIHRDIKPSNIIITKDNKVKVLDFGIAKLIEEEKGLTKTGVQIGTVSYMSPEQVNGEKVDKSTDIYSLGVTLWQMAVGKAPYDITNSFQIQLKIINEPLPLARTIYPAVSTKIEDIILKATQKNKVDRYKNCKEFIDDINSDYKKKGGRNKPKRDLKPILYFLFVLIILVGGYFGWNMLTEEKIYGCTDITMYNYDSQANTTDNSCIPFIYGCTDSTMYNYDSQANTTDNSCIPFIYGCTDITMYNYDSQANVDDGECIPKIYGCIDRSMFNYNSRANTDDGECIPKIYGCTDSRANNHSRTANTNDGSCRYSNNNSNTNNSNTCISGNCENGYGTYIFSNGDKYVGQWKDGKRTGQGTYTWPNGDKYVGEFKDYMKHGKGTYTWDDGDKYVGEWRNNKMHGQGTYTYDSGAKRVGKWRDGKKHGKFKYYDKNGSISREKWNNGVQE